MSVGLQPREQVTVERALGGGQVLGAVPPELCLWQRAFGWVRYLQREEGALCGSPESGNMGSQAPAGCLAAVVPGSPRHRARGPASRGSRLQKWVQTAESHG